MARKSRRQSVIAQKETVTQEKVFKTGLYVRLSIEDVRDRKDSDSIENQTYLLKQFVEERPFLQIYSIYTDNGEKGTNFDRPEFNRLMDDVKAGRVNCIVVKDLSRFGRDYLETGNYLEKIFPFLGVRFISINDNYDSFNPENSNEGLIISLKNLLNDVYTKDISKKIISTFRERQSKGEFLGAHVPYGYSRPDDGTYKLVVDEEAALVIRQIYQWKVEGLSDTAIARRLNDMGIPSPSKYKYLKGEWKNARYNNNIWQRQAIKAITENEVYLGHKIYGKIQASLYEGKRKSRVPRDEWTIIENDHEPIIDQETFDIVHARRLEVYKEFTERLEQNKHFENTENIFKDIAICGDCKCKLVRRRRIKNDELYYYFSCTTYETNSGYKCTRKHIVETDMIKAVYAAIRSQIDMVASVDDILRKVNSDASYENRKDNLANEIRKVKAQIERLPSLRSSLYDDYIEQLLTEQEYLYAKIKYEKDEVALKDRLNELLLQQKKYDQTYSYENQWLSSFRAFRDEKELTKEMVAALIETVELYADRSIQINFKFKDEYEELLDYLNTIEDEVKPDEQECLSSYVH
ncbi:MULTISPECIES: recombinase family protein [Clostridia]|jgi:DNA invertase Pin-like site-specific DNA recombinase|uniref:Recombinase n=1 Tax=Pseudobacteroides cellulosolvens ATCC 35603 = DSM 2933 TaxID=398512 RepID=A0A0L6JPK0_9FIRM|nr:MULTISPECIES: recombinase family protein [Clostridia]KNY27699.1 Recombinase [Pseudobacteroides cellulosolvens ATCC 35603 = DSM 2933]